MRVSPEQLPAPLQRRLLPVYLVTGDEPLQVQECCDAIRRHARDQGCTDREVFDAGGAHFDEQVADPWLWQLAVLPHLVLGSAVLGD